MCHTNAHSIGLRLQTQLLLLLLLLGSPVSTTYLTPGMVMDVSAMLVARIALRMPAGAGSNTYSSSSSTSTITVGLR
jgi:hypothetical protein